jgi:hypothetical protein
MRVVLGIWSGLLACLALGPSSLLEVAARDANKFHRMLGLQSRTDKL